MNKALNGPILEVGGGMLDRYLKGIWAQECKRKP